MIVGSCSLTTESVYITGLIDHFLYKREGKKRTGFKKRPNSQE